MIDNLKQLVKERSTELAHLLCGEPQGGGSAHEILFFAPYRADNKPSLRWDTKKLTYYDDPAAQGGDIFTLLAKCKGLDPRTQFAQVLKVCAEMLSLTNGAPHAPEPRKSPAVQKQAGAKGPSLSISDLAKGYGLKAEDFASENFRTEGEWIVYPCHRADGAKVDKVKSLYRFADGPNQGKRDSRHRPGGIGSGLIGKDLFACSGMTLVLAGGEEKVLAAKKAGPEFAAICSSDGEKAPKPELCKLIAEAKPEEVVISFDADHAGRKNSITTAQALIAAGVRTVRIVQWGPARPKGYDLNDLLKEEGPGAVRNVIEFAAVYTGKGEPLPTANAEHPAPLPLVSSISTPMPFPTKVFGPWLRDYITQQANALQVPEDLVGMASLGMLSTALASKVEVSPYEGFTEPSNLYCAIVLDVGERKSSTLKRVIKPMLSYEASLRASHRQEEQQREPRRKMLKEQQKKALAHFAREQDPSAEAEALRLAEEIDAVCERPTPQIFTDNTTSEALAVIMADNGGRFAIIATEGGIFDIMGGQYSKGSPNVEIYLKAHSGDPHREQRITREALAIDEPALTILVSPQPSVIEKFGKGEGFKGRGLLARFFYSFPAPKVGTRKSTRELSVDSEVADAYFTLMLKIFNTPFDTRDGIGNRPFKVRYDRAATDRFQHLEKQIEPRLEKSKGDLASIVDWASKYLGLVARLSVLLHAAKYPSQTFWTKYITADTVEEAIELGKYALHHAQRAYALMGAESSDAIKDAKDILAFVEAKAKPVYSYRDFHNSFKRRGTDRIRAALEVLVDKHWLIEDRKNARQNQFEMIEYRPNPTKGS